MNHKMRYFCYLFQIMALENNTTSRFYPNQIEQIGLSVVNRIK